MAKRRSKLVGTDHQMYRNVRARTNRFEYGMVADKNICSAPMSMSAAAGSRLQDQTGANNGADVRPVVQRRMDRYYDDRGRLRSRQQSRSRMEPPISGKGVRASIFIGVMAAVAAVLLFFTLVSQLKIMNQEATNAQLRGQLERTTANVGLLQAQIDAAKDEVSVAYSAKEYGLVSAGSLPVIILQAPSDAQVAPVAGTGRLPGEVLAIILGK